MNGVIYPAGAALPFAVASTYGAKGDGVTDDTAALNRMVGALAAAGGGWAYVPPTAAGYVIKRQQPNVQGDTSFQAGGIRLWAPNVRLVGEMTRLILKDNCDFINVASTLNATNGANGLTYAIVTADVAIGDRTLTVDDLTQFGVGDKVFVQLGQSLDAGEPDHWYFAKVAAKSAGAGAGTVTLDTETSRPMTVASTANTYHRSIRRFATFVHNVHVEGFELICAETDGPAESGVTFLYSENCSLRRIVATNPGAGITSMQFSHVNTGDQLRVLECAKLGSSAKGNVIVLAETRNCRFADVHAEGVEGILVAIEEGCESNQFDNLHWVNNFDQSQPAQPITPPATAQNQYTYSGTVPSYLKPTSFVKLTGGANPAERFQITAVAGATVTLNGNIGQAGHTTAQIVRDISAPVVSLNAAHNTTNRIGSLFASGKPSLIANSANGPQSSLQFGAIQIDANQLDADQTFGGLPLDSVAGPLTVNRVTYQRRRMWRKAIFPVANGNTFVTFPRGFAAHTRLYTSTKTGLTGTHLAVFSEQFSSFQLAGNDQVANLTAGATADLSLNNNLLAALNNNFYNHNDRMGLSIDTNASYPVGSWMVVEVDLWVTGSGFVNDLLIDTTLGPILGDDYSDGLPVGASGLIIPGKVTTIGHQLSGGAAPTAAAGANAGTSPPAPVVAASANDTRGTATFGTGTTPAAGAEMVVTFAAAYGAAPVVTISPLNAATAALQPYVSAVGTGGFTVSFGLAPAASQANTTYAVAWSVG